jgi:hypothetical protein
MAVASRVVRIASRSVDHRIHARMGGIRRVNRNGARNADETTADIRNHHVPDCELRARVRRIDLVGSLHGFSFTQWLRDG